MANSLLLTKHISLGKHLSLFAAGFAVVMVAFLRTVAAEDAPQSDPAPAQDIERTQVRATLERELAWRGEPGRESVRAPEEEPPISIYDDRDLPVRQIEIIGNSVIPSQELMEYLPVPVGGMPIRLSDLKRSAQQITQHYRQEGYLTSRAYVPPQNLNNGIAIIQIVEGRWGAAVAEGNRTLRTATIERYWHDYHHKVFRYEDVEFFTEDINRLNGVRARAYLLPGSEPLTTDMLVKMEEEPQWKTVLQWHNRGSKQTHTHRGNVTAQCLSPTGSGDILKAGFTFAEESAVSGFFAEYRLPVNGRLSTSLSASYFESLLIRHLKPLEIKGYSLSFSPELQWVIWRNQRNRVEWVGGIDWIDSKSTQDDNTRLSFDRMRVLYAGIDLTTRPQGSWIKVSGRIRRGLPDFLGSLEKNDARASQINSGGDFQSYTLQASQLTALSPQWRLATRFQGQWSTDTLTSAEKFRAGGYYSVRGYPEADSSGDSGYTAAAEIFTEAIPFPAPTSNSIWLSWVPKKMRPMAFVDLGRTLTRERSREAEVKNHWLISAGPAASFSWDENTQADFAIGFPFGDPSSEGDEYRIHFDLKRQV